MISLDCLSREDRIQYMEDNWVMGDLGKLFAPDIRPAFTEDLDMWDDDIIAELYELARSETLPFSAAMRLLRAIVEARRKHGEIKYERNTRWVTIGDVRDVADEARARVEKEAVILASGNTHIKPSASLARFRYHHQDTLSLSQRDASPPSTDQARPTHYQHDEQIMMWQNSIPDGQKYPKYMLHDDSLKVGM